MTFEEWWNGIDYFGLRSERGIDLLCHGCSIKGLTDWLDVTYYQGYEQRRMEDSGEGNSCVDPM